MNKRLTDSTAAKLPVPATGYTITWCGVTPGFGVRVTAAGARAWVAERRIDGKTVRRTLGKAAGRAAISADAARRMKVDVSSELQQGRDRLAVQREQRKTERAEALTLGAAVTSYVEHKRRTKDGLPLKQRTGDDYLAMVAPAGATKRSGRATLAGPLHALANRSLQRITGDDIRRLYADLAPRGERQRRYAMQVLRAVLREHGVAPAGDDPFGRNTAGAKRIRMAAPQGKPTPIPAERLGAWWRAASVLSTVGADQLRFQLLTGCRPGEAAAIKVRDFDAKGDRVKLHDTKNRSDHVLVLSKQAASIAHRYAKGGKAGDFLFGVADPGKSMDAINEAAGAEGISAHKLRHTFASIAAELLPHYAMKAMLNRAAAGDVDAAHYVHVGEAQLRAGWQAVADFIEAAK